MTLDFGHGADNIFRTSSIPYPPTCHGISFGDPVDEDSLLFDLLSKRGKACEAEIIIDKMGIDFISDDVDILFGDNISQGFQLMSCIGGSGWVGGIIQYKGLGGRSDGGLELFGGKQKSILFLGRDDDSFSVGQGNGVRIGDPIRSRNDDFLAFVDQSLDDVVEGAFCSCGDNDFILAISQPEVHL